MLALDSVSFNYRYNVLFLLPVWRNKDYYLTSILLSLYYRWRPCPLVYLRSRLWKWYKINGGHVFSILILTVAVAYSSRTSFLQHHSYLFVKEGHTTTLFINTGRGC